MAALFTPGRYAPIAGAARRHHLPCKEEPYKKLCRHIYCRYPQLVRDHVALYRALFEPAEEDNEE